MLKDPLIQLLLLEDVRQTRLSGSGLSEEEKEAGAAALEEVMTLVHAGLVDGAQANDVLGVMREISESGAPAQLDDAALRDSSARLAQGVRGRQELKDAADLVPVNREMLLNGYASLIDGIVGASTPGRPRSMKHQRGAPEDLRRVRPISAGRIGGDDPATRHPVGGRLVDLHRTFDPRSSSPPSKLTGIPCIVRPRTIRSSRSESDSANTRT